MQKEKTILSCFDLDFDEKKISEKKTVERLTDKNSRIIRVVIFPLSS